MEKSKVIEKLFEHIVVYSYLILPLLYLILKEKKRDGLVIAVYGTIIPLLLFFYYDVPGPYVKLYQSIFTFFEYTFFAILFYFNLRSKKFKVTIIIFSILFYIFQFIHYQATDRIRIDSIPIGVESIMIFIYIFFFFMENLNNPQDGLIYTHHCFWISVGLLLYLGGSFFLYTLGSTFSKEEFEKYWFLNYIADTIKTIFFAIALLFLSKKVDHSHKTNALPFLDMLNPPSS